MPGSWPRQLPIRATTPSCASTTCAGRRSPSCRIRPRRWRTGATPRPPPTRYPRSCERAWTRSPDARSERAAIERGFGEALTAASDLAAATLAFARTDEARADRPANLFERVEQLLLHHSLAALADAQGDAEARRRALVAAIASAAPLVDELPKSRLHSARVRAALPALIARATAHGVADPEQTLTRLLTAASSR